MNYSSLKWIKFVYLLLISFQNSNTKISRNFVFYPKEFAVFTSQRNICFNCQVVISISRVLDLKFLDFKNKWSFIPDFKSEIAFVHITS